MVKEVRKIIFDQQDLVEGMLNYTQRTRRVMPSRARITGFDIQKTPDRGISLKFNFDDPEVEKEVILYQDEIGAALIMQCKVKEIPLPRSASKSLEADGDSINLVVAMDWRQQKK
ncbi:MAG: hypothetical protein HOO00_03225 [Rhodospirillaceae bacterium]|jgi:hypothetical protein|nr:hypothetical protein [Rhodospirillaceae bacterium]MBT5374410.1 hypothetical protein [Rhodospirillaceae bacterium]MBT5660372.1 hypothetical protein [Rhodospirillaceae bacterium]MBT5752462.1 hypothetical protein [Rhodospirillaceae bacterium]